MDLAVTLTFLALTMKTGNEFIKVLDNKARSSDLAFSCYMACLWDIIIKLP